MAGNCLTGCGQKLVIEKIADGVFKHRLTTEPNGGYIFTKGFGVIKDGKVSFYTPEGTLMGTYLVKNVCVDGQSFTTEDELSVALKDLGHIIYDASAAAAPPDYTTFQVQDCDGNDIGTPVDVVQSVVLNKVTTSICNVSDLVDPLLSKLDEVITTINNTSSATVIGKEFISPVELFAHTTSGTDELYQLDKIAHKIDLINDVAVSSDGASYDSDVIWSIESGNLIITTSTPLTGYVRITGN